MAPHQTLPWRLRGDFLRGERSGEGSAAFGASMPVRRRNPVEKLWKFEWILQDRDIQLEKYVEYSCEHLWTRNWRGNILKTFETPWKWKESENHMEVNLWRRLFGRFYLEDLGGLAVSRQQLVLAMAKISKNPAGLHGFDTCSRYRFMITDRSRLKSTIVCLQCGKPNDKPDPSGVLS